MSFSLTPMQLLALDFIRAYLSEHKKAPSCAEITDALDLSSKSCAHRILSALEERGRIRRLTRRARAIELCDPPPLVCAQPTVIVRIDKDGRYHGVLISGEVLVLTRIEAARRYTIEEDLALKECGPKEVMRPGAEEGKQSSINSIWDEAEPADDSCENAQ